MSVNSSINWTQATWNPVTGCTKISPGCKHCYAEKMAKRLRAMGQKNYARGFDPTLQPQMLDLPLRWGTPKKIFVNSMSDLFHEDVPDEYIEQCGRVMEAAHWHCFQVLTKRAERMRDLLQTRLSFAASLRHIWWGVSVEDRKYGLPRIDALREAPAAVRFLSCEPLLQDLGEMNLYGIHWVITGGESGPGARAMHPDWVNGIRIQCEQQNIPFFHKQNGGVRKHLSGRLLNGRTYDDMPASESRNPPPRTVRLALLSDVKGGLKTED